MLQSLTMNMIKKIVVKVAKQSIDVFTIDLNKFCIGNLNFFYFFYIYLGGRRQYNHADCGRRWRGQRWWWREDRERPLRLGEDCRCGSHACQERYLSEYPRYLGYVMPRCIELFYLHFYPRPVLAFGYCSCQHLCVSVSMCQPCVSM